jgi:hypothetical protein
VPGPPAGPGVQPPFAAPPSEGRNARVWLGLGVAGLAVVLCCGGGIASVVGLVATGVEAANEQAHAVVEDYLQAVGDGRYGEAYRMLCRPLRQQLTEREFAEEVSSRPRVREYVLLRADLSETDEADAVVPADVTYTDGTQARVRYRVEGEGAVLRFCGTTG